MHIASWNVNSIRARENQVLNWIDKHRPDVICLQEIKCLSDEFPYDGFEQLGYFLTIHGQKAYNGVAIGTLSPPSEIELNVPWVSDSEARGLSLRVRGVQIISLYVPNGSAVGSEKYSYKLNWLDHLWQWLDGNSNTDDELVLCGDFNIAPEDRDVYDSKALQGKIPISDEERKRFASLINWGLTDAFRVFNDASEQYTWWDYREAALVRGHGLRIDLHLVTDKILRRIRSVEIDTEPRFNEKPSDHVPVSLYLMDI